MTHYLRTDANYVACLNTRCGHYFSIEDCEGKLANPRDPDMRQKMVCPYCEYQMCPTCIRPYHGTGKCGEAKAAEDQLSLQAIRDMGAKPCPNPDCGAYIEKNGGCQHMTCKSPRYTFKTPTNITV